ncbi:MAG: hypothetical protein ACOCP8_06775 [archaeon]
MGLEEGFIKYVLITPLSIAGFLAMYTYGGVIITLINTFSKIFTGNFLNASVEYFINSALPPTSINKIIIQTFIGSFSAGVKWLIGMGYFK